MSCLKTWMIFLCYFAFLYVRCNFGSKVTGTTMEYIYFSRGQSWQTASRVCQSIGAHLFTVTSKPQVEFLKTNILDITHPIQDSYVWIGLHRSPKETLVWSDAQCSQHTSSMWSNFVNHDEDDSEEEDKQCFSLNVINLLWYKKSCNDINPFICERNNKSDYIDFKTRLSLVPLSSASRTTCQAECDSTIGCFMFAPYCDEYCILGVRSTSNSSTQLYKRLLNKTEVLVDDSDTDSYKSDDDGEDPLPCKKDQLIKEDLDETLDINCSAINQSNLKTVTLTPDVVTSIYMLPCSPSTVVSTEWITPSPVIHTIYITPTPCIETTYTTTLVIETSYMTPRPTSRIVSFNSITTSILAPAMTSSLHLTPSTTATSNVICTTFNNTNISQEALKEVLEEIVVKLKVDTKTLSTTIRKKKSAPDNRKSSTTIGYTATVIMCVPFVLIVLADVPLIFKHLLMSKVKK